MRVVIDERADARQRDALAKILTGQETEDMATMWWVFGAMIPDEAAAGIAKIEFEVDVDRRDPRDWRSREWFRRRANRSAIR